MPASVWMEAGRWEVGALVDPRLWQIREGQSARGMCNGLARFSIRPGFEAFNTLATSFQEFRLSTVILSVAEPEYHSDHWCTM